MPKKKKRRKAPLALTMTGISSERLERAVRDAVDAAVEARRK